MTTDELLTAYAAGRRDFSDADLIGADLRIGNRRATILPEEG